MIYRCAASESGVIAPRPHRERRLGAFLERVLIDRKVAYADSGGSEDGIGDGRRNRGRSRFAAAAQRRIAFYYMHLDGGAIGEAHHRIVRKILLLDGAPGQRDLAVQHRAQAKNDGAFDLRLESVRVDREAAIHGASNPVHFHITVIRDFNLGDVNHDGAE